MSDIITICGIIIGIVLLIIGKKRPDLKLIKIFGILIIIISLAISAPEMIKGFKDGWNAYYKS